MFASLAVLFSVCHNCIRSIFYTIHNTLGRMDINGTSQMFSCMWKGQQCTNAVCDDETPGYSKS